MLMTEFCVIYNYFQLIDPFGTQWKVLKERDYTLMQFFSWLLDQKYVIASKGQGRKKNEKTKFSTQMVNMKDNSLLYHLVSWITVKSEKLKKVTAIFFLHCYPMFSFITLIISVLNSIGIICFAFK